jgi:hypothetical protein
LQANPLKLLQISPALAHESPAFCPTTSAVHFPEEQRPCMHSLENGSALSHCMPSAIGVEQCAEPFSPNAPAGHQRSSPQGFDSFVGARPHSAPAPPGAFTVTARHAPS